MTAPTDWRIPPSTRRLLEEAPTERAVAVLVRHSVRGPLPPGPDGVHVPLTADGVRVAGELGQLLGHRIRTLRSSPVLRCVQTAEAVRDGAGLAIGIEQDRLLGRPGAFVCDSRLSRPVWEGLGHEAVMARLVSSGPLLTGMAAPSHAARFLVQHMLAVAGDAPGLHLFVTHDSLVTATAAQLLGEPLGTDAWPWYLEAAVFWRDGDAVRVAYRERRAAVPTPLCALTPAHVVELARREVGATVGLDCQSRFFLAGGAFKALLTGRAVHDLDLWPPSEADRAGVVAALLARGAEALAPRPFADAFEFRGRVIEVAHRTDPASLEERLARFDIGLSAVGAEHLSGDRWRAVVDPLATESVARRLVLLLKPLANWRHALATLERMRRYAAELGYEVPEDEVAEVWRVFDAQDSEMQRGMLARFDRSARGGYGVREEAVRRLL